MPQADVTSGWRFLVDENLPEQLATQLRAEGHEAEHAYDVGLRGRLDSDMFAYVRMAGATLITQDHDLERDTDPFPIPHPGLVLVELPQSWPREDRVQRILAAVRSLAGQSLQNVLLIVAPSQVLVRR